MNLRLILPLVALFALTPLVANQHGFGRILGAGGYMSNGLLGEQGSVAERQVDLQCVAAGADVLRRAAPPVVGGTVQASWPHRSIGLTSGEPLDCP